jgi:polysaccharide deacetylase family sporulation protein PdaB
MTRARPAMGHPGGFATVSLLVLTVAGCRTNVQQGARTPARTGAPRGGAQAQLDRYWQNAKEEVDKSVLELLAQHQVELERGTKYDKFIRGDPAKKHVAITFDDGPHPDFTPKLLEILKQYGAKATFFVVGEMAEKSPELVKAEMAAGHDVGNHTYHHVNLTKIPNEDVATEIKACGDVIQQITGKAPHLFRPPGGDYNKRVAEAVEALGYTMVLWTDDPGDYASPGDKVIETRLLDKISNGGIILLHDGVQQTVDVLPQILQHLKSKGFEFVTVDEMMGSRGKQGQ